jgi:hypothetical protein
MMGQQGTVGDALRRIAANGSGPPGDYGDRDCPWLIT